MNIKLRKIISIFAKLLLSLFLGAIVTLNIAQQDPWVISFIEENLKKSFAQTIKTEVTFRIQEINLMAGKILISSVKTKDNNWYFNSPTIEINFSMLSYFLTKAISTKITFYHANIFSLVDKDYSLAILKPINDIINAPSSLPINIERYSFKQANIKLQDNIDNTALLLFSSDTRVTKSNINTILTCIDGKINYANHVLAQKIAGTVKFGDSASLHLAFDMPQLRLDNKRILITGDYKGQSGQANINTIKRELDLKIPKFNYNNGNLTANFNIAGDISILSNYLPFGKVNNYLPQISNFTGKINYSLGKLNYNFDAQMQDIKVQELTIPKVLFDASGDLQKVDGSIKIFDAKDSVANGTWQYDITNNKALANIKLSKDLKITRSFNIQNKKNNIYIEYIDNKILINFNALANETYNLSGFATIDQDSKFDADVKVNKIDVKASGSLSPIYVSSLTLLKNDKELMKLDNADSKIKKILSGKLDFSLIKDAVIFFLKYELKGEGALECKIIPDTNKFTIIFSFAGGNIKIPTIYNVIKELFGTIEIYPKENTLIIKDLKIVLHKGKIESKYSKVKFLNSGESISCHLPISFSQVLVNWKKDFVAMLNGAFTLMLDSTNSNCSGYINIEDAYWRTNLLSGKVQKDFLSQTLRTFENYKKDIKLNFAINTENNMQIKTDFIQTSAQLEAQIKGTISNPELTSTIELIGGKLQFPYKPLYLASAKLYLSSHQIDDPTVELIAKSKIKKYNITLSVSGTTKHPKINLESTPTLSEEQILALLIAGSEESSLYAAMPNLIMQNLENLIFGNKQNENSVKDDKLQKYFKKILKPLKNIKITPSLTDNISGKEIKGSIEIDINDRLRAKIQKSLDLTESPHVEVEYNISDDTSVKAVKNESDGVGAEVEMRWKF